MSNKKIRSVLLAIGIINTVIGLASAIAAFYMHEKQ